VPFVILIQKITAQLMRAPVAQTGF